MVEYLEYT